MSLFRATTFALVGCALAILNGCKQPYPAYNTRFTAFGTLIDLSVIDVEPGKAEAVSAAIEADLNYLSTAWHAWRPGPLGRVNALLPTLQPFSVPPSIQPLIVHGRELSDQSGGLFNPAIGRLLNLWGFQTEQPECNPPPSRAAIEELVRANPQMSDLHMEGIRLWSTNPVVRLDFGAFAKGYAMDLAIQHLRDLGVQNAIINAGGDVRAIGDRDGHPWRIAIRRPTGAGVFATIGVENDESLFTTGDYESNFIYRGEKYHHNIDPRTGYPARGTRSVTVLHTDAATAGAAASALFVAGPAHWLETAKAMGIRYVLLVDDSGTIHANPAMAERVKLIDREQDIELSAPLIEKEKLPSRH